VAKVMITFGVTGGLGIISPLSFHSKYINLNTSCFEFVNDFLNAFFLLLHTYLSAASMQNNDIKI
jgi:hypothetical protein